MTQLQYLKKFLGTLPELSKESGYPVLRLAFSYGICYIFHGANSEEFRAFHLYECTNRKRAQYVTYRRCERISDGLCAGATAEELAVFDDKHLFNAAFRDYIHRDWLYMPDSTVEDVRAFLGRNEKFLAKATVSTQGKNIFQYHSADVTAEALYAEYQGKPFQLETFITQHHALTAINASTVNTVRIVSARKGDRVLLVGACLRCGGATAHVDNFHQGGVAYPLDIETGIVSGLGRNLLGQVIFLRHPSTGHIMPGFQVPNWDILKESVRQAALVSPHVGYIGWDIAITEDGVEFVEGNINYPDPIVMQLDGPGAYQRLKDFLAP